MTNSIQQNVSTIIFKVNAGMPGTKQGSQPDKNLFRNGNLFRNETLFRNENLFRILLDSLNNLSDELTKLDSLFEKKHMEK